MATLCPTGGSYWDPRCCWWCTNSWVCTAIVRLYDVVRIVLWFIARVLDLIGTIIFNIIIPFLALVFVSAVAFINFMVGLLFGEFRLELTVLMPLFVFVGSWLLWLFWPQISCFIPTLWKLVYEFLQVYQEIALLAPTLINLLIRTWNALVPIVGFLIYITIVTIVLLVQFTVELLGEFDVMALFTSIVQIMVIICEILLNLLFALVGVLTTDLSAFNDAVGATMAVIITSAKILIAVTVWLFGALWQLLEPILVALIAVFKFIKNHFLLRQLYALSDLDSSEDALPGDRLWRTLGVSAQRYWDESNSASSAAELGSINRMQLARPPSAALDYFWFQRSYYAPFNDNVAYTGRGLFDVPDGWKANATRPPEPPPPRRRVHTHGEHVDALAAHLMARPAPPPLPHDWLSLEDEIASHHVECRSHMCGGAGKRLRHPIHTVISEPQPWLYDALGAGHDHRTHRRRFIHTVSLVHAVRKTAAHVAHKHWANGDGEFPRRVQRAWQDITGHNSLQAFLDHHTSHHEHPIDSLASLVPTPSNWTLVRALRRLGGDDGSDGVYHADWLAQRHVHYAEHTADERGRRRLHVTRDEAGVPHRRDARGKFAPEGDGDVRGPIRQKGGGNQAIPTLPVFELLYTQNCISKPRNQLCLPEISPQLGCLLAGIASLFPKKPPVEFCDYEQQCADVGFCIVERPKVGPDIFVVLNNVDSWISWCWLQNGLVWFGVLLSLILPVVRITFQVLSALIPFLSWFFDAFVSIIPGLVSTQELVCLIPFFYGFVLWVVILYLVYLFVLPLLFWFWRTLISTDALFSALRAIEATRLAYLEQGGSRQLIENFWRVNHNGVLPGDPWMNSPLITKQPQPHAGLDPFAEARAQASRTRVFVPPRGGAFMPYIPLTGGFTPDEDDLKHVSPLLQPELEVRSQTSFTRVPLVAPIAADIEAAAATDEPPTPEAVAAIRVYTAALRQAEAFFGRPAGIVTFHDIFTHEARFRPLIHSVEWSATWLRRYTAEYIHQAEANRSRRPPPTVYQRGMFDDLF